MARKSFKAEAKDRVDDLQGVFSELQNARRECRNSDLAILEEQLHLMLREWKSELHNPSSSSATSSLVRSFVSKQHPCASKLHLVQKPSLDVLFRSMYCFMYGSDHSVDLRLNLGLSVAHICIDSNLSLQVKKEIFICSISALIS